MQPQDLAEPGKTLCVSICWSLSRLLPPREIRVDSSIRHSSLQKDLAMRGWVLEGSKAMWNGNLEVEKKSRWP